MSKCYVIIGSSGCYSDYESHVESVYMNKELANVTCHQMNVELKRKKESDRRFSDRWDYEVEEHDLYE